MVNEIECWILCPTTTSHIFVRPKVSPKCFYHLGSGFCLLSFTLLFSEFLNNDSENPSLITSIEIHLCMKTTTYWWLFSASNSFTREEQVVTNYYNGERFCFSRSCSFKTSHRVILNICLVNFSFYADLILPELFA